MGCHVARHPVRDIWLQTVEALHTSHVRNYSSGEGRRWVNNAMLVTNTVITDRLSLEFRSWVTRMHASAPLVEAIRLVSGERPGRGEALF